MARAVPGGVDLLLRLRSAATEGQTIDPKDARALAAAIDQAVAGGSLEEALGLFGKWRDALRGRCQILLGEDCGSVAQRARELRARLERYRVTHYAQDLQSLDKPFPGTERRQLYDILFTERGKVPAVRTLQRRLSGVK